VRRRATRIRPSLSPFYCPRLQVNMSGCCRNAQGRSNCCCGIEASTCVSTLSLLQQWLTLNRCSGARQAGGSGGSRCTVGVGCAAETSLCLHENCYHAQWSHGFAAAADVLDFFARVVTAKAQGREHQQQQQQQQQQEPAAGDHTKPRLTGRGLLVSTALSGHSKRAARRAAQSSNDSAMDSGWHLQRLRRMMLV